MPGVDLGAHLSTSGGAYKALERAHALKARSLQIFTQSPRMWRHPDLDPAAAERFRATRPGSKVRSVVCHATYLINLGATDETTYQRSVDALTQTVRTAVAYGVDGVIVHTGSHLGTGLDAALERVVPGLTAALAQLDGPTRLLLENTAGAGNTIGVSIEELAIVIDALGRHPRLGICLDTCHLYAAGIDITDPSRVEALLAEIDERIGLDRLRCLHVNDSQMPLGSNRDRHANVGKGLIGARMATILGHPALQHLPAVMETPGPDGHGPDAAEMRRLARLHRAGVAQWATAAAR
jgi:deoxyribonuclease-4